MTSFPPPEILDPAPFRDALRALYADLDAELARLGPVCRLSGRCCRFAEYGHTLFVSNPELALLLADAPPPSRPLDDGATCPWQDALGRCTAREARPLGCRLYYCDPSYAPHSSAVGEAFVGRLKQLAEQFDLPWGYAPLHHHLRQTGTVSAASAPPTPPVERLPESQDDTRSDRRDDPAQALPASAATPFLT